MAVNASVLRRPSDRGLFLTAAIGFPLLVFIGYFRSYYFGSFFGNTIANSLVHFHGVVMTMWVLYFAAQIALVRSKNIKLHMTLGLAGIFLAALVVVVGLMTAYDAHMRDFEVIVPEDCTASENQSIKRHACEQLRRSAKVDVVSTRTLLRRLASNR